MKLIRQDYLNPNIEEIERNLKYIDGLYELSINNKLTSKDLKELCDFQDDDGSFKLLNSYEVESDIRVYYCHYPTQVITAIIINEIMKHNLLISPEKLYLALERCCDRNLRGHGYDAGDYQGKIFQKFYNCKVLDFIHKKICNNGRFVDMIKSVGGNYVYVE